MDKIKKSLLPLFILFLFVSLVVIFRSSLLTNIVEPVVLILWLFWRIISSVDQSIYWVILIIFCTILVIRIIPYRKERTSNSAYDYSYTPVSRVEYWQKLIIDADLGKNESEYLRDSLKELLINVISQAERSGSWDSEKTVAERSASMPLEAQRYLFPLGGKDDVFYKDHQRNIKFLIPGWIKRWSRKYVPQDHSLIDETIRWMETELEINDE